MEKPWTYLVNQFINATKESYKKALKLSNYHDAALKTALDADPANPDWMLLYNRYHPVHLVYVDAYSQWKNAGGSQEGQTLNLEQHLELLVTKAARWDAQVQVVYDKKSVEYKTLFPNGRAPFTTGSYITRILALQTLGTALTPFAALIATKMEVDAFYTTIDTVRDTQEGTKGTTKSKSEQVEDKRIVAMTEQYRDLGYLINLKAEDPDTIAPFFELSILRNQRQSLFTGTLDTNENEPVLVHSFVADDELELEITQDPPTPGIHTVSFYLATIAGGTDSTPVTIIAGIVKTKIQASAFGISDYGTHRFLTAVNNSAQELHYKVELL